MSQPSLVRAELKAQISVLREELRAKAAQLAELQRSLGPIEVADHDLMTTDGPVKLSAFFQGRRDLVVIHNMGRGCNRCTLWADGFNGIERHVHDRAALLLVSADPAEEVEAFADSRGWTFAVASGRGIEFTAAMGFEREGKPLPGLSTFHRDQNDVIWLIAQDEFELLDPYSSVWHLLSRLKSGIRGWEPKAIYPHDEVDDEGSGHCCGHCDCH